MGQAIAIILVMIFMYFILTSKSSWTLASGFLLVFSIGSILYLRLYIQAYGDMNVTIVFMAVSSSLGNFFANNNALDYYGKVSSLEYLVINLVFILSIFVTVVGLLKVIFRKAFDRVYFYLRSRNKLICIYPDVNANSLAIAQSTKENGPGFINVFLEGQVEEIDSGNATCLLVDKKALKHIEQSECRVFLCSEDNDKNLKDYEELKAYLKKADFYRLYDDERTRESLLVNALFVKEKFTPSQYNNNEQAQICIIGATPLAVELCKVLIQQCQTIKGLPKIKIIGENARDVFALFVKTSPDLKKCADLDYINSAPDSVVGIEAITGTKFHMYFFCDGNDNLHSLVAAERIVKMPEDNAIYDFNVLVNYSLDKIAKELNFEYIINYGEEANPDIDEEWLKLDEFTRNSNRSQAINIPSKLFLYKRGITAEQLSEEEHLRWNAFHYVNGWRYGHDKDGKKDRDRKLHPCLVDYNELPQTERDKDLLFIKKIIEESRDE